ncbi:MAG: UbiX family flavin prenyltransferase [Aquificae bacterium]|nr:UbiX family flavin prenyltransferase [Aquificota bacterium]
MRRAVVCITGASGVVYGLKLIEALIQLGFSVDCIPSKTAYAVYEEEHGGELGKEIERLGALLHAEDDFTSPLASGSQLVRYRAVFVAPCSASTLAHIASGTNKNLIHRVSEVALKERVPLVLLLRETPLSAIHIENMLRVSRAGALVVPASPAFYHKPKTIEDMVNFVVGKLLDAVRIEHNLYKRWKE